MKNEDAEFDPVADLHERQRRIRQEMGGADRVGEMKRMECQQFATTLRASWTKERFVN